MRSHKTILGFWHRVVSGLLGTGPMAKGIAFGIAFSLIALGSAHTATIYVPDDYPTIQDAINACVNGDTVIVRPGTYVENIDFVGKAITVQSEYGAAVTTIDGGQLSSVVVFKNGEDEDSIIDGFTIANGCGTQHPFGQNGGGIYCNGSSPTITNNTIKGNSAVGFLKPGCGGGIFGHDSSADINNCIITGNHASSSGGGISCDSGSPTITNNIISGNTAGGGGGIYCGAATITNTILWDNSAPTDPEISGNPTVTYSDVKGGWSGTGNIDADPLFADSANSDFHLTWDSPCRNTGVLITKCFPLSEACKVSRLE